MAIVLRRFEDLHAILPRPAICARILKRFGHPDAPALVKRKRSRIDHLRFMRHALYFEPRRQLHLRHRLLRRKRRPRRLVLVKRNVISAISRESLRGGGDNEYDDREES